MNEVIKNKIENLPLLPGVYLMMNKERQIIYIGKAKKLKNRVSQYFLRPHEGKTQKMVMEVEDFDIIITSSEAEALILELNLVHKHDPKYNILLKDGRTFPYIEISSEKHPMLKITRGVKKKNSLAFGPFPDSSAAYEIMNLLNTIFPLRKCAKIPKNFCLYYHMHQCLGPCINQISDCQYQEINEQIKKFLNGDVKKVVSNIKEKMLECSNNLEFEKAKEYKDLIDNIEYIIVKQKVQFDDRVDRDVFAFHSRQGYISIAVLMYRSGILSGKDTQVFSYLDNEEETFIDYIVQFYQKNRIPKQIIVPNISDVTLLKQVLNTNVTATSQGIKHDLLQMAGQNAVKAMDDQQMIKVIQSDKLLILEKLGEKLNITTPLKIELIDNSHHQGDEAVSAVVVFINGVACKKLYRRYKVKGDSNRDDLLMMAQTITRRYTRLISEHGNINDLLIVDGGVNQVNAVKKVLIDLGVKINLAGLVKDDKHRTRGLVNSSGEEIYLNDAENVLSFLARMQDEVHRYAINYHHNLKTKSLLNSMLDDIEGIGEKRKILLLKTFGSVAKILEASESELLQYVPKNIVKKIKENGLKD